MASILGTNYKVFNDFVYGTAIEVLADNINLFNAATKNAIQLKSAPKRGDFADETVWTHVDMVKHRDPYSDGDVAPIDLEMDAETSVKIGAGTYPIRINPSFFRWIGESPKQAGLIIGKQLAPQMFADKLSAAISAVLGAMVTAGNVKDNSAAASPADMFSPASIVDTQALMGDAAQSLVAWVVHSKPMHDYWKGAVINANSLFNYSTVNVVSDPFGRPIIMTDAKPLITAGAPNKYNTLALVSGAVTASDNDDFDGVTVEGTGKENIVRMYQAEWSYNVNVKGMAWDKETGGKNPTTTALLGNTWKQVATSKKNLAGVVLVTH